MYAFKGDRIYVPAGSDGAAPGRRAEVLGSDHPDGHPPFWVRWSDSGEEDLVMPTAGAIVEHAGPTYPPEYDADR